MITENSVISHYSSVFIKKKKHLVLFFTILFLFVEVHAQDISILSPNKLIEVKVRKSSNNETRNWSLKVSYKSGEKYAEVIPEINLGLSRNDQTFANELVLQKASKPRTITEQYTAIHGKRSLCRNSANEIIVSFENPTKAKLNLIIRAYNDGLAFRYEFPEKEGPFTMKDEFTSYAIPQNAKRWMEKWNTANENLYSTMNDDNVQKDWGYPALFANADNTCWYLIHEADVNRNYCASKLSNTVDKSRYKITFPDAKDGNGLGESTPTIALPWQSPWRVVIIGKLSDIVESTLVDDVCPPSVVKNIEWIKPGLVSWNYWSNNHGTKDYKVVCDFADLAANMNWPYTLLDWEWNAMGNGGNLEDAAKYILSKGVKPLIWYNSGGKHTNVSATPRDRMLTHENRMEEFAKLKKLGFCGVKIDFFESEKQDMIKYYLDILDDAAQNEMMVYFHGCIVPRGWARTYPHLMTYEGIRGAEWYNNTSDFTMTAPEHNTIVPFTRNVIGAMDYTPVTFTNSQYPHITSYAHELALSVVFESGFQHMADRPSGYYELPDAAKNFLREVPNAWDDTKLLDGYPGRDIIIARRKGCSWYIGGLNAEKKEKNKSVSLSFLPEGQKFKVTLITDGEHDKAFSANYMVVDKSSTIDVKMLRRGGFVAQLKQL
jgi:hypothetical protein